jgi:membrane associated rhomboid family serine protease
MRASFALLAVLVCVSVSPAAASGRLARSLSPGYRTLPSRLHFKPAHNRPRLIGLRGGRTSDDEKNAAFAIANAAVYAALYLGMTTFGGIHFITAACWAVWTLWQASVCEDLVEYTLSHPKEMLLGVASSLLNVSVANNDTDADSNADEEQSHNGTAPGPLRNATRSFFKRVGQYMEGAFLAPSAWRRMRARPMALFGSAFSHIDVDHISGNLVALRMCGVAETWLGTHRFAHLYLTSALLSQCFCCVWHKHTPRVFKKVGHHNRQGLGASGAISGVMAWYCIESFKRGHNFMVNGREVSPLWFWALYVAIDLLGLLRLGLVQKVVETYLGQLMGSSKDDAKEDEGGRRPRGEVGYDAHLGGAIAGLLWHLIPSVVCMPR